MRVTLFVTSLIAAVAALPAMPAAGNSALATRAFANDDFEIADEPDFVYAPIPSLLTFFIKAIYYGC